MGERRDAVEHERAGQRAQRMQGLSRQRHPADEDQQQPAADDADQCPHAHLQHELAADAGEGPEPEPTGSEQARHQRDADRVVRPGLALQDRAAAAAHLALTEHREHDRRIGRGDGRAEQHRDVPTEAEGEVGEHGHRSRRQEGAEDTDRGDRAGRGPEPRPADVQPTVEQDAEQRNGHDPLDGALGRRVQLGDDPDGDRCGGEEQRWGRHLEAFGQPVGEHRQQTGDRGQQHQQRERGGVAHQLAPGLDVRRDASTGPWARPISAAGGPSPCAGSGWCPRRSG